MNPKQLIAGAALLALILAGCSKKETAENKKESNKVRVGWIGLTCEASIFSAVENGYFKDEGLDVELIKCDWKTYKDTLALGGYDITQHLVMYFLKPIEQGLDIKFTGGIHSGCLRRPGREQKLASRPWNNCAANGSVSRGWAPRPSFTPTAS